MPCPPPGDLPDPGIEPVSFMSCALARRFSTARPHGKPIISSWVSSHSCNKNNIFLSTACIRNLSRYGPFILIWVCQRIKRREVIKLVTSTEKHFKSSCCSLGFTLFLPLVTSKPSTPKLCHALINYFIQWICKLWFYVIYVIESSASIFFWSPRIIAILSQHLKLWSAFHSGTDKKGCIWESWFTSEFPGNSHKESHTVSYVKTAGIGLLHNVTRQGGEGQAGSRRTQSSRHSCIAWLGLLF